MGKNSNFFSKDFRKADLGQGCEVWSGWHQSVRVTQRKLMVNVDFSTCSFYKPMKMMDFANELLEQRGRPVPHMATLRPRFRV